MPQLEEQQLVRRLLEIQVHLPKRASPRTEHCERFHHGPKCQTCLETFDSTNDLDKHIGEYQNEQQELLAALPLIHAHSARQDPKGPSYNDKTKNIGIGIKRKRATRDVS
ncbi:hypothetical protein HC256_004209 [Beauveria bassiana]|nr:hypothetical protein HC256_004209 [Beauveria bassiana]